MSPTLATGQYRFVLTWGETPLDLDSHLKTPVIEGHAYQSYYQNYGSASTPPYAILDIDDTDSFGPETTTIYDLKDGIYHYYIHNYSQTPDIITSHAVVQIYNETGLLHTLQVPTVGSGIYWDCFTMNGATGAISIINQIVANEPGGMPYLAPVLPKKPVSPSKRNIVSWNWNFGDGGTSTDQNPSHKYLNNGVYTVSLIVSDGTTNNTETKTNYISIGQAGTDDASWTGRVSIYPNPAKDILHVNSGLRIDAIGIYDMNGYLRLNQERGFNYNSIDLGGLPNGTYILRITTEKGQMQRKLNINR
jgi:hypothetical protein